MRTRPLLLLTLLAFCSLCFSLLKGSTAISLHTFFLALFTHDDSLTRHIILQLRVPRTFAAFATGGLLALAGSLMQVLLRNPLADPYVLGISGGAAVGSLLCILAGCSGFWINGGAWLGSLSVVWLVFVFSQRKTAAHAQELLLTGIAMAAGLSAVISLILLVSPDTELRGMLFWLLGDLSSAHFPLLEVSVLLIGLLLSLLLAPQLNILVRGELAAQSLGLHTQQLQWQLYLLSSLMTAVAVTCAGCIGFIGLIVPHGFRLLWGYDHRSLIPGSVLLGGSLLTVADTLGRTVLAPQQLPVGILMAFLGVPVFLGLLRRKRYA